MWKSCPLNENRFLSGSGNLNCPYPYCHYAAKADFESPIRFARLIKRGHNVIHVHNVKDARMAVIARRISENKNTKVVLTCHTVEKAKKGFIHRMIYNELDRIIFVSELAKKEFLTTLPDFDLSKTSVIYDSVKRDNTYRHDTIDIRRKFNIPETKKLIMFHGRICEEKGVSILLRAITQLDKDSFHLVIMGRGEIKYMGKIKAFIVANQLLGNVSFLGYQNHIQPLNTRSSVVPSIVREAFRYHQHRIHDAWQGHISTNHGAQCEYIENGKTGLLVNPEDYKALASAIESLITNDEMRIAMGEAAKREFDSNLAYDHFSERIKKAYE